jgi:hypothetical protein
MGQQHASLCWMVCEPSGLFLHWPKPVQIKLKVKFRPSLFLVVEGAWEPKNL